ncbi:MAG: Cobalt-zinc-cadmium resistance protein CzcA; Cation efflux system protein CusA [uncultured Pyrinomonadaceae bacterium]|uniref:Cobalt-zinc-cadmium resistance protein CzcA Cation efflux system protein CusA n=1 Tax=uncultured Pyrinomonadaceae bacterium TaxID=2283094 RepID=A0A6J4NBF7_9BACT|nr:MAG: Cobalt-zinc-cadmium resistance protein CzcA; Cation efflux system protein CusA [uncultured Pyrinomonadaceae bacterium]
MRTLADWTIRPRLLTITGISQVIPIGGGVKQYQALVSPEKLAQFGITIEDVTTALEKSNANSTGGFVDAQSQEYLVRNLGRFYTIDELKQTVVAYRNNTAIRLGDVANVEFGARIKRGDAGSNGKPAVIMSVQKQPGASTIELTEKVETAMLELQTTLPPDIEINTNLFRQSNFIEASIGNVVEALRDGAILVAIVLFLFLLNFRTTAITLTAIPLSFVVTFLVLWAFGISINTMTLGGLAVAIGELVDDAIVDIENIFRRLRENRSLPNPLPSLEVIYRASLEVRSSIVYATIIVALVFLPLFMLTGVEGRLLAPLGLAYITSLVASLFVSLTITPVLASYLLPQLFRGKQTFASVWFEKLKSKFTGNEKSGSGETTDHTEEDSFVVRWLKKYDERLLHWTLRHPYKVMAGAAVLFLLTMATLPFVGTAFLPEFNEGTLTINVQAQPGTSLSESNRIGQISEKLILEVPEVASTGRRTGRAELDEHAEGVHYTEIDVDLKESERTREEILADIREKLALVPGVSVNVGQPISHRLDHLQSGVRAQIAVKLFGDDLGVLRSKAEELRNVMQTVEGATDVQIEKQVLIPQVRFNIDRARAAQYGLQPGEITETLETALNGRRVSEAIEGARRYDVVVRFDDASRNSLDALRNTTIDTPQGTQIPISAVADIEQIPGPNQILRENTKRRIVVSANTGGRDLGSVVQDMQQRVNAQVNLPPGYFVEFGGQFQASQEATKTLSVLTIFSLAAIFFLLIKALGDWRSALQVMINIPLALIGAVIALLLTGGVFSIATLVGFISLVGITSRNGIMMISHYLHLMREEGENFTEQMIVRGSLERLVPVLMTALTAGLSLIPFILAADAPGKEILHPLAVVVVGGILTATLLDQLVTPAVFYKFGKPSAERIIAEREGRTSGSGEWGDAENDAPKDADVPPFSKELPKPV